MDNLEKMFWSKHYILNNPNSIIDIIESAYYQEPEVEVTEEDDSDGLCVPLSCFTFKKTQSS